MKRYLVPLGAALAVVAVLLGLWSVFGTGSSGDDQAGSTSGAGGGSDPSHGSAVPGDPGSAEPLPSPSQALPVDPARPVDPLAVRVDSYHAYDGARSTRVALSYTIGVPECYGTIDTPEVEETPDAVVVTLTRVPPEQTGDVACIEIALLKSVDIELSTPLGSREVLDGSTGRSVVPPGPKPTE